MPNKINPKLCLNAHQWFFAFYEEKRDGHTDEEYDRARREVSRCLLINNSCLKLHMFNNDKDVLTIRVNQLDYSISRYNYPFASISMVLVKPYMTLIRLLNPEKIRVLLDGGKFEKPWELAWIAQKLSELPALKYTAIKSSTYLPSPICDIFLDSFKGKINEFEGFARFVPYLLRKNQTPFDKIEFLKAGNYSSILRLQTKVLKLNQFNLKDFHLNTRLPFNSSIQTLKLCIQIGPTFPERYQQSIDDMTEEESSNQLFDKLDNDWFSNWSISDKMTECFQKSLENISNIVDKQKCMLQLIDRKTAFFHCLPNLTDVINKMHKIILITIERIQHLIDLSTNVGLQVEWIKFKIYSHVVWRSDIYPNWRFLLEKAIVPLSNITLNTTKNEFDEVLLNFEYKSSNENLLRPTNCQLIFRFNHCETLNDDEYEAENWSPLIENQDLDVMQEQVEDFSLIGRLLKDLSVYSS